ncbi:helix-turn-helix domain-containing protein [Streptomyces sp. NPDC001221]
MDNLIRYRRQAPPDLGPMLRAARLRAGLLVSEAAFLAGISRPQLSNIEAGRRLPSVAVAQALADVLCLDGAERARLLAVAVDDAGRSHPGRAVS